MHIGQSRECFMTMGGYDYDEFGGEMGEVCNVVEERPSSPPL